MTRSKTRILEIATWWPPIYMVLFIVVWLISFLGMAGIGVFGGLVESTGAQAGVAAGGMGIMGLWAIIFPLHALTMVVILGLLFVYAWHIVRHPGLETTEMLLWLLVMFMGGPIGQLVYFYKEIKPTALATA